MESWERWERQSHLRRGGGGRSNPSFSSSLLDAIYRSIDENDGGSSAVRAPDPFRSPSIPIIKKKQSTRNSRSIITEVSGENPMLRRKHESINYYDHRRSFTSTFSFSSDAAETPGPQPIRPGRIGSDLLPPPPPPASGASQSYHYGREKIKKISSIHGRFRDLRKARTGSAPSSPGARLANFLNSLFSGAGSPKKAKTSASSAPPQIGIASGPEDSACSSGSSSASRTRSCLSKTPPSCGRIKRSVRFGPVSVLAVAGEDDDDSGCESDGSSDLFELEDLSAVGGRYRDELPVYETTRLPINRAFARGLLL